MSTNNLCFGAIIRKIGIPLHTPVLLYKIGVRGWVYFTRTCFRDGDKVTIHISYERGMTLPNDNGHFSMLLHTRCGEIGI